MHLEHKTCKKLISLPKGSVIRTTIRWRDDQIRRALGLLRENGYYKIISKLTYERTTKESDSTIQ